MPNNDDEVFRRVFNGIIDAAKIVKVVIVGVRWQSCQTSSMVLMQFV